MVGRLGGLMVFRCHFDVLSRCSCTPLQYRNRKLVYLPRPWGTNTCPVVYYPWDPVQLGWNDTGIRQKCLMLRRTTARDGKSTPLPELWRTPDAEWSYEDRWERGFTYLQMGVPLGWRDPTLADHYHERYASGRFSHPPEELQLECPILEYGMTV